LSPGKLICDTVKAAIDFSKARIQYSYLQNPYILMYSRYRSQFRNNKLSAGVKTIRQENTDGATCRNRNNTGL